VVDQNVGSGAWVTLLTKSLPAFTPIDVTVSDVAGPSGSAIVLRADAIKFIMRTGATSAESNAQSSIPESFALEQNHPNPFNPSTVVGYAVPKSSYITLKVYDLLGRQVAVLFEGMAAPGWYTVNFQGTNLPSGTYLCRLEAGGFVQTKKMLLLK
jgi:hypothetical protein